MSKLRDLMDCEMMQYKWFSIQDKKLPLLVHLFGVASVKRRRKKHQKSVTVTDTYIKTFRGKEYLWREEIYTDEKTS